MAKRDTRPWAFDDCPQWQSFTRQLPDGLSLAPLWSCYSSDYPKDLPVRGHNIRCFAVSHHRDYKGTCLVHGYGPDGFNLYLEAREGQLDKLAEALIEWRSEHSRGS